MKTGFKWTKPYFGLTHLKFDDPEQKRWAISIQKRGELFQLTLHDRRSDHPFTAVKDIWGSEADLKATAEEWASRILSGLMPV